MITINEKKHDRYNINVLWDSETLYKRHLEFLEEQEKRTPASK